MKLPSWLPMLWSEVVLITVTLCSEVSQLWMCANFNVFRTVLPELLPTPPSIHTSLQLEKHYIGCRLSTVLSLRLPCLFISSYTVVTPNTFEPFLIPRHSAYNTRRSQSDGMFLEVPHFASVFKSRKHFGLSFAYDAPMIWNDLPDEVRSANSLASFRSKLKSYLFGKAYPP